MTDEGLESLFRPMVLFVLARKGNDSPSSTHDASAFISAQHSRPISPLGHVIRRYSPLSRETCSLTTATPWWILVSPHFAEIAYSHNASSPILPAPINATVIIWPIDVGSRSSSLRSFGYLWPEGKFSRIRDSPIILHLLRCLLFYHGSISGLLDVHCMEIASSFK